MGNGRKAFSPIGLEERARGFYWQMFLVAMLWACAAAGSAQVQAPTLAIDGLGKGTAAIDGPWQFHLGDDPAWVSANIDDTTGHGGWEQITANEPWGAQGRRSYTGYAWYRKHLHVTPAPGASPDFAMLIVHIDDIYEIYWNGVLVGHNGKMPPGPSWVYEQGAQTFGVGHLRDGVLAVRVWKSPLNSFDSGLQGGFYAPPLIGSPAAIADRRTSMEYRWLHHRQYFFGLHSLYALVMVLSVLTWMRDRSQRVLLWMAVFSGAPLLSMFLVDLRLPLSFGFALGWLQPVLSINDIGLWFLLLYLLRLDENRRLARFTKILAIISLVSTTLDGLLTMVDWSNPAITSAAQLTDAVLTAIFTLVEAYPVVLVGFALGKRLDLARWLVAGCAFLSGMVNVTRIALEQGSRFTHWTIGDKIAAPLFTINDNPFTAATLAATALLLAIVYAVYQYSRETIQRQQAIEQELRSAQELQRVLVPEALPSLPGFALTSSYRPAQEVGGDFFQIIPLEDRSALIVLGDVSGKGLRAAMAVSLIVGALRTLAENTGSPAAILAGLNRRLHGRLRGGFATCVVMRLDPDGTCVVANAGHPAPFLNKQEVELPGTLPLGVDLDVAYSETTVQLRAGDYLALYTDGLCEARTPAGELYSFDRLNDLLASRPDAARATEAAVTFGQQDDITVLTLTRLALGQESRTELIAPALAPA